MCSLLIEWDFCKVFCFGFLRCFDIFDLSIGGRRDFFVVIVVFDGDEDGVMCDGE